MHRLGDHARHGLSRPRRIALDLAGYGLGALLAGIAVARGGKAVHPCRRGLWGPRHHRRRAGRAAGFRAVVQTVHPARGRALLAVPRSSATASRPAGGVIEGARCIWPRRHQDVLMVSSVDLPVLHHIFVPATDFWAAALQLFAAEPRRRGHRHPWRHRRPDVAPAAGKRRVRPPRPCSRNRSPGLRARRGVDQRTLPARRLAARGTSSAPDLRRPAFQPLQLRRRARTAGALNRLRDYAYPLSQAAWARRNGRAHAQQQADVELDRWASSLRIQAPIGSASRRRRPTRLRHVEKATAPRS